MNEEDLIDSLIEEEDEEESSQTRKRRETRPRIASNFWTDEKVAKLITEVEIRPCLWNAGVKEYKSRTKRDSMWNQIAVDAFDDKIGATQISSKWQSLRTQYRTNVTNAKKTKSGQGAKKKPHWKWHDQMAFVGDAEMAQTAPTESNLSISGDLTQDGSAFESASQVSMSSATTSTTPAKRNRPSNEVGLDKEKEEVIWSGMQSAIEHLNQKKEPADDIQSFGNYIVSKLRTIQDANHREQTQRRLTQVLWEQLDQQPVQQTKINLIFILFHNFFCFEL